MLYALYAYAQRKGLNVYTAKDRQCAALAVKLNFISCPQRYSKLFFRVTVRVTVALN